jgi:hypothetical protein
MMDAGRARPFHERFDVPLDDEEAHRRFIHRMFMVLFDKLYIDLRAAGFDVESLKRFERDLTYRFGEQSMPPLRTYIGYDFPRCLWVLEVMYQVVGDADIRELWSEAIRKVISDSEVDLGIDWQPPTFVRTGAKLLDERLVNESLQWLADPNYQTVYEPFSKGLGDYVEAINNPGRLRDVVTEMYEAIEALARIVTGRDRDLSANREMFISSIGASDYYKQLLGNYIDYANRYRHAAQQNRSRPPLKESEVESFIYLTGMFIRLVVRTT